MLREEHAPAVRRYAAPVSIGIEKELFFGRSVRGQPEEPSLSQPELAAGTQTIMARQSSVLANTQGVQATLPWEIERGSQASVS